MATDQQKAGGLVAGALALLIALGLLAGGQASPPPAATTTTRVATSTPTSSTTTTAAPSGGVATWRQPVAELGVHPRSAEYAKRCFEWCSLAGPGKMSLYFDDYSVPVYDIRTATTTIRVFKAAPMGFAGSVPLGGAIPWSPAWKPPTGNDLIMVLANPGPATTVQGIAVPAGTELDLWSVFPPGGNQTPCVTWDNLGAGLDLTSTYLCVGGADWIQDAAGRKVDWRTATTTYPTGGGWFAQLPMLLTPADIRSGRITHALDLTIYATMFGPACSAADRANPAKAGFTCGFYEPPASNLEWGTPAHPSTQPCGTDTMPYTDEQRAKTIPEGARPFAKITPAEIAAWEDSRGYTGQLRETVRIIAEALSDRGYGGIDTNTSCHDAGFRTSGRLVDGAEWTALGIPTDKTKARTLLDGFFTAANLRFAAPSAPPVVGSNRPGA